MLPLWELVQAVPPKCESPTVLPDARMSDRQQAGEPGEVARKKPGAVSWSGECAEGPGMAA